MNKLSYHDYTNEQLLQFVKDLVKEMDRIPRYSEVKNKPEARYASFRYHGWKNVLFEAGLTVKHGFRDAQTANELISLIQEKTNELGRTPLLSEMENSVAILKKFGSWRKALVSSCQYCPNFKSRHLKVEGETIYFNFCPSCGKRLINSSIK